MAARGAQGTALAVALVVVLIPWTNPGASSSPSLLVHPFAMFLCGAEAGHEAWL